MGFQRERRRGSKLTHMLVLHRDGMPLMALTEHGAHGKSWAKLSETIRSPPNH